MRAIRTTALLGVPLICGALLAFAGPGAAQNDAPGPRSPGGDRLIVGLAPDTAFAQAWEEGARVSADVAQDSPLAAALETLVGMPIRDIRLGSGRTASFAPDWDAMGGVVRGGRVVLTLPDARLAAALAERLDPVSRGDGGTSLEIDPARSLAAMAQWLGEVDPLAYAQVDRVITIDR